MDFGRFFKGRHRVQGSLMNSVYAVRGFMCSVSSIKDDMLENINNSCFMCHGYFHANNNKQVTVCLTGAHLFLIAQW